MVSTGVGPSTPPAESALLRLRPRDVPGLFDQAVWLYRRNFRPFVGIAAVVQLPAALILALATSWLLDPTGLLDLSRQTLTESGNQQAFITATSDFISRLSLIGFISILSSVLMAVAEGALARAIADRYLGRPVTVRGAYRAIRPQIIWLIALVFVEMLASYLLILLPLGIYVFVALSFVSQVIVIENTNVVAGIQRSWQLVRGQWWRVAGMTVLVYLISIIFTLPALVLGAVLPFLGVPWVAQTFLSQFVSQTLTLMYVPAQLSAMTLLYFDLRIRKEGYDLEVALAERGPAVTGPATTLTPGPGLPAVTPGGGRPVLAPAAVGAAGRLQEDA